MKRCMNCNYRARSLDRLREAFADEAVTKRYVCRKQFAAKCMRRKLSKKGE